jgi:alginate O-acetyltransferase complex protein AlgI
MNFVSPEFFTLFGIVLCLLAITSHRAQNTILLLASLIFYGWWYWKYLVLMIGIATIDYVCALYLENTVNERRRKTILAIGLSANIAILAYFKYIDFGIQSLNDVLTSIGFHTSIPVLNVLLPIAISFHTFQSISYLIDVYRGLLKPIRNFFDYQLFVCFFPVLVAGPIERATQLLPQVLSPRKVRRTDFEVGIKLVILGFFKKVVIADNLAPIVDGVFTDGSGGGLAVVLGTFAFALQIYGDFSGYTDIARGISRLMGFHLMENFRQPYFAINPSDFWRRWHISLSTWLRDYLYIPLGGSRHGILQTYFALAVTMILGGLWHGASWTFVLWGVYHGILLIGHRMLQSRQEKKVPPQVAYKTKSHYLAKVILFFQLTCFGWLIFRAQSLDVLLDLIGRVFQRDGWFDTSMVNVHLIIFLGLITLALDLWATFRPSIRVPIWVRYSSYVLAISGIIIFAPENVSGFIYSQF